MNKYVVILLVVGVVFLIVIGWLAGQVGGVTIRSVAGPRELSSLQAPSAVSLGVPVRLVTHLSLAESIPGQVWIKTSQGERLLQTIDLPGTGQIDVLMPCDLEATEATFVLRNAQTNEVVAQRSVHLLPPSFDCAL